MKTETLLVSDPDITTYNIIHKEKLLKFSYELRYYPQREIIELVKIKSSEYSNFVIHPLTVTNEPMKILEVLKKDKVSNEIYFKWEKTILQFVSGGE